MSFEPTRSRVMKVEAMPLRPLSRNSMTVSWVPTATMSSAAVSSARGVAMSSLVPVAGGVGAGGAGGGAGTVGVGEDLGTGGRGGVGHGVHIADDHVRSVAGLDDGVGAAVDADEQRPVFADVGGQHRQVLLVVVAAV